MRISQEAVAEGACVSRIARNYDVSTNQVFKWVREFRRARDDTLTALPKMLPVVLDDLAQAPVRSSNQLSPAA